MSEESILVVGASSSASEAESALTAESWSVTAVAELADAPSPLASSEAPRHHIIVLDVDSVPDPPWRSVEDARREHPDAALLLLVSPESKWASLSSYQQRPAGLVPKPLDRATLLMAIDSALVYRKLLEENRTLKRQLGDAVSLGDWVGGTPQAKEVRNSIATASLSTGPVTLLGEPGSGRRLAAELIHRHGRNPGSTFLPMDLTSLPLGELHRMLEEVGEAADRGRGSYVHGARPGTLYLAELTALGSFDQEALRDFVSRPIPFRLIASAHPSIEASVRKGEYESDTFSAASKVLIRVPALRERRGDVPILIDHFLKRFCRRFELRPLGIPSRAIENYSNYDWPGNVAELSMIIERAVSIASAAKFDGTTLPEHFCAPPSLTAPAQSRLQNASLRELIADIEKRIILQTLERFDGSQKRAAQELGVNPTTLHEKMKRYKILPDRGRSRA